MTIDEFLEHGWIQNDNIPDTVLFTPTIIANDVSRGPQWLVHVSFIWDQGYIPAIYTVV
jgi:hypothetical protein